MTLSVSASTLDVHAETGDSVWEAPAAIAAAARAAMLGAGVTGVEAVAVDERLKLKRCAGALATHIERPVLRGRGTVTVSCPGAWRLFVPVRVTGEAAVLVLTRALEPGQLLTPDDLAVERRSSSALPHDFLGDVEQAVGLALRRTQPAGTVLALSALERPEIVARGALVTLISSRGPVTVKAEGIALEPGRLRQRIRVRTASGRVVEGTAEGPGHVRVGS